MKALYFCVNDYIVKWKILLVIGAPTCTRLDYQSAEWSGIHRPFLSRFIKGRLNCANLFFDMKIRFHSRSNKTRFHIKGCAPGLVLFMRHVLTNCQMAHVYTALPYLAFLEKYREVPHCVIFYHILQVIK